MIDVCSLLMNRPVRTRMPGGGEGGLKAGPCPIRFRFGRGAAFGLLLFGLLR